MDRLSYLQKMRDRHGDVFTVRPVNGVRSVVVSDPELIKLVFTAPAGVLHAGACNRQTLGWLLGEHSLLLLDEERHLDHRRLMLPSFHRDRLERHAEAMRTLVGSHLDSWPAGEQVEALPRLRALTLDVVLDAIFGSSEEGAGRTLRDLLPAPLLMANTGDGDGPVSHAAVQQAKTLIRKEVTGRRAETDPEQRDDIFSQLLAARYEDGSALSDVEVRDELLTLIVAGTGTTANSLAWALERLARAPEALAQTAAEAADGGGPYTTAAIYETMRMRPAVPVLARLAMQPFQMGEHSVSPGTIVAPSPFLVHHRPDIYPDPMSFRPERFLEKEPGTYTWMPFGGGVRRCIGSNFALLEMRVVLAALLSRIRPRAIDEEPEGMHQRGNAMVPSSGASLVFDRAVPGNA